MKKWVLALVLLTGFAIAWAADPPRPAPAPANTLRGKVLEVKDVESYTYLRLKTKDGEIWAAVGKAPVKAGTEVTIENVTMMTNFESKTLKRKFDQIAFGNLAGTGPSAAAGKADMAAAHAGLTKTTDVGDVAVAKATGPDARTVAEIVSKKGDLKDKPVVVRGKIVKFTGGVLDKNWIHLRDGSGSAADGTNDILVTTKDEAIWAAVAKAPVKSGTEVTIENVTIMTNFESKTLKRKFDQIAFGNIAGAGPSAAAGKADMAAAHAGLAKTADVGDVTVAKATGPDARTVAEIVSKKGDLKDKPVVVRGKIVKFTGGVLDKNWIHLRDGSGSATDGTNDILVTTKDEAKIGDVVLVKGVVHTDRDFGSGYSYKVLIEEATLQK